MIDRSIAVFSGIHPRVVDKLGPELRSVGIEPVAVASQNLHDIEYFERLAKQTLYIASKISLRGDVRLSSILISSLQGPEKEAEAEVFFPALRRIQIRPEWRNNPSAAKQIAAVAMRHLQANATKEFTRYLASNREPRLLLPPKNTPSKALIAAFKNLYGCEVDELGGKVMKDVVLQRRGRGLKVSDLQFAPVVNGTQHPVRRCTDTSTCDLQAKFRFGVAVAARFEFDVTSDTGLASKTFRLCDGQKQQIGAKATHLNMRINDDFKEA